MAAQIMRARKLDCKDTTQPPAPAQPPRAARTLAAEMPTNSFALLLARRGRIGLRFRFRVCLRFLRLEHWDAERNAHFVLDAPTHCCIVLERLLRVLASLTEPLALIGEPSAAL